MHLAAPACGWLRLAAAMAGFCQPGVGLRTCRHMLIHVRFAMFFQWHPLAPGRHPLEMCKCYVFLYVSTQSPLPPHLLYIILIKGGVREKGPPWGVAAGTRVWMRLSAHTRHVAFLVIFPHNLCIRRNTPQSDQTGESFLLIRNRLVSYDKNEYTNNGRHRASSNEFALA